MRTFTGLDMIWKLLNGTTNSATLEAALTTGADTYLGPWIEILKTTELNALLNNSTALDALFGSATAFGYLLSVAGQIIAASDTATEALSNNSAGILTVVTNTAYLDLWQDVSENKSRLQARINVTGSKLLRWNFTADDTWDIESLADGLAAYAYFICGEGGTGSASSNGVGSGSGGTGAQAKFGQITTGLPTSNQAVTVGTGDTSIGALHTALKGIDGSAGATGAIVGPGTSTGTIYDPAPTTAIWQPNTGEVKGANGGYGLAAAATGNPGGAGANGITGTGGTCAGSTSGGLGGNGLCSGGAGGGVDSGYGASAGGATSDYGCGSGGASLRGSDIASGGTPGGGLSTIYGVAA
jgi:hypothetical protein